MKDSDSTPTNIELFKPSDLRTRDRLLEAAGVVFSEKGFEHSTAREICSLAQVNSAAVNYYFGGKERLYVEVLREAHRRLLNVGALRSVAEDIGGSQEMLESFLPACFIRCSTLRRPDGLSG